MRLFFKILNYVFAVLSLLVIGFMLGRKYDIAIDENDKLIGVEYSTNELKIRRLVSLIDSQYMDEVNSDSLVDKAINQIIGQLDPHSTYLSKKDLQQVTQEMSGHFNGLGIKVRKIEDTLTITQVLPQSPNYELLFIGDKILKIDSVNLSGLSSDNAQVLFKENQSNQLALRIKRDNEELDINAKKGEVKLPSVVAQFKINQDIGYIKLVRFAENSAKEIHDALLNCLHSG